MTRAAFTPPPPDDEDQRIREYVGALEREVEVIEGIGRCAASQCAAVRARAPEDLAEATRVRGGLVAELDACEREVLPLRQSIGAALARLDDHPMIERLRELHGQLRALIESVLKADEDTRLALRVNDDALRSTGQELEAASATLMAYRRVVAPLQRPATLVNRHG